MLRAKEVNAALQREGFKDVEAYDEAPPIPCWPDGCISVGLDENTIGHYSPNVELAMIIDDVAEWLEELN